MFNDKIMGMMCITGIVLALLAVSAYTGKAIDTSVKEVAMIVVSGILGNIIGVTFKRRDPKENKANDRQDKAGQ